VYQRDRGWAEGVGQKRAESLESRL